MAGITGLDGLTQNLPSFGGDQGGGLFGGMDFSKLGDIFGSKGFGGALDLGSLALGAYGLNKSLGFAEDQLGILKDQENRAASAQNLNTGNSLSLALQTTTPGTAEHARIQEAVQNETFKV